ncbi:heavy-metal-associated domain-containing protein [Magnetococcales bacterium HHB-1]
MAEFTLKVAGMTCPHCVKAVENAVLNLSDIQRCQADQKTGTITIYPVENLQSTADLQRTVSRVINDEGYSIIP